MLIVLLVLVLLFFLLCSGIFSASETALFSLSSMKVKALSGDVDPRKRIIARLVSRPRDLLVTIIMLNVLMNILIQNVISSLFGDFSGWALNVGVPLGLTLIFGEVIPKSVGFANNEKVAYLTAPLLDKAQKATFPFRKVLIEMTNGISRVLFFFLRKEEEISVDELQHALATSRQYGVLNAEEADLIRGYLYLEEATVKELMRPREEVIFYDLEDPLSKLIHLFVDRECTRIPVCKGDLDHIQGIMSSRIFFLHKTRLLLPEHIVPVLKKPFFFPESSSAKALFRQMYERKESLAVVVDEYGSVSGLITLEDLVEQVVGDISDRRDQKSGYTRSGEDVIIASGKLELDAIDEIFGVQLESANNLVTIGGWLTEQMGDIPKSGDKFETEAFFFHVLSADPQRVRRVYIRRIKPPLKRGNT